MERARLTTFVCSTKSGFGHGTISEIKLNWTRTHRKKIVRAMKWKGGEKNEHLYVRETEEYTEWKSDYI